MNEHSNASLWEIHRITIGILGALESELVGHLPRSIDGGTCAHGGAGRLCEILGVLNKRGEVSLRTLCS